MTKDTRRALRLANKQIDLLAELVKEIKQLRAVMASKGQAPLTGVITLTAPLPGKPKGD